MGPAAGLHLALVGFMGAGKSTAGARIAHALDRPFVDLDTELERAEGRRIPELFAELGEAGFREREGALTRSLLEVREHAVLALGGGAVTDPDTRATLRRRAFTVLLDVSADDAWRRARRSDRPLARDEAAFRRLYESRRPLYREVAQASAADDEGVLLAAGGVHVERGVVGRLGDLVPGKGSVALVADERVLAVHTPALGARLTSTHAVPSGEAAKSIAVCERLWSEIELDRSGIVVALGGGTTTDVAGFVAATYLRGLAGWVPVPSTLVGQVDAGIGGKTGVDLAKGKNLVGAFNPPALVVIDPDLLATLPERQRAEGMAEVVKTGLLAGGEIWRLEDEAMVRACAAYKAAVVLADPTEQGRRAVLNLGHTFAHGIEAAGGYEGPSHGEAVALGLRAALRLSERHLGLDSSVLAAVEAALPVEPARVDPDAAWRAMAYDKKARGGQMRLVLLEAPGKPRFPVTLPEDEIREALVALTAA